jgi:hypothetical protein
MKEKLDGLFVDKLVEKCYSAAYLGGWWKDLKTGESLTGWPAKKNIAELLCLIHSEVSEAYEANKSHSFDDKLPGRLGLEVELADAVIRIADMAGGLYLNLTEAVVALREENDYIITAPSNVNYYISEIHLHISNAMECARKNKLGKLVYNGKPLDGLSENLARAYIEIVKACAEMGLDLFGAVEEKLCYNASRADHKPENRIKEDGKKF